MEKKTLNASQKMKRTIIGEIPVDWEVVSLQDVCSNIKERATIQSSPYIEIGDIDIIKKQYKLKDKVSQIGAKVSKKGDIIISTVRPDRGAISKVSHNTAVSSAFVVLRDKKIADWEYIYQVLTQNKFFLRLGPLSTGSTYPTCSTNDILTFNLPLPPLSEQKKIAEILSSVDDAIEKTQAVIDQTEIVKKGLMQELLTRGIPGKHKKFKKTEIGEIPEDWEVVKLENLLINKPEYGANYPANDYDKNLPRYIRITDISESGELLEDDIKSLDKELAKNYLLSKGDFLFARSGATVGKTYLYNTKDGLCAFASVSFPLS